MTIGEWAKSPKHEKQNKTKQKCSANYDPQAKPSVFVNKVLLEHIHLLFA